MTDIFSYLPQFVGVVVVQLGRQGREPLRDVLEARPRQLSPQHAVLQLLQRKHVAAYFVRNFGEPRRPLLPDADTHVANERVSLGDPGIRGGSCLEGTRARTGRWT